MNDDIAIKVDHVSKTFKLPYEKSSSIKSALINFARHKRGYEIQHVLDNVSLEVKKGEFFGIVGRNGSGKSTLLKMLAGIYTPTKGSIHVNGKLTPFIELGVGFNPELTGRENVFLNGALLGFSRKEMEAMYKDIVEFAELERFMNQKLKNYSSGMQVRLAFSIAIRANTEILILDEVLAVGDAAFQQKCFEYFMQLKKEGRTVVLVTHDMSSVQRFCTRAIYINNGKILHDGKTSEVAKIYIEENINNVQISEDNKAVIADSLKVSIVERTDTHVDIAFECLTTSEDEKYFAFSMLKDGVLVSELNSFNFPVKGKQGKLIYSMDTSHLNVGIYEISGVVCRKEDRHLLALAQKNVSFALKGSDGTHGGALKLAHTWRRVD